MSRALVYWQDVLKQATNRFCFDSETTGFGKQCLVVQLGYCSSVDRKYDSHLLGWTKFGFEDIVDPVWLKGRIEAVASHMALRGTQYPVTFDDLDNFGLNPINVLRGYLKRIQRQLDEGGFIAGHNVVRFDIPLLERMCREFLGKWTPINPDRVLDTMAIERSVQTNEEPRHGEKLGEFTRRMIYSRMQGVQSSLADHCVNKYRLDKRYDIDLNQAHSAGFDSMLVCVLLEEYERLTSSSLEKARTRVTA